MATAHHISERELQQGVVGMAQALGWQVNHVHDSRSQNWSGLPDLLLRHEARGVLIWVELKTEKGVLSRDRISKSGGFVAGQQETIEGLRRCGQTVYIWRPSDWLAGNVERVLRGVL